MVQSTEDDAPPGDDGPETDVRELVRKYLRSKAKGQDEQSGTYRASAKSELDRWCDWLEPRDYGLEDLGDPEQGPQVMRRYAQRLRRRARSDDGIARIPHGPTTRTSGRVSAGAFATVSSR